MAASRYDEAVWHEDTWKFHRANRQFRVYVANDAMSRAGELVGDSHFHRLLSQREENPNFRPERRELPPFKPKTVTAEEAQDPGPPPMPEELEEEEAARVLFEGTEEEQASARKIQAVQRGRQARSEIRKKREAAEQERAAVRIQAVQRGRQARRQLAGSGSREPPATANDNDNDNEQSAAALKIQSVQRGRKARKEVAQKKMAKQEEHAAVKIQSVQRGRAARKEVAEMKQAAVA